MISQAEQVRRDVYDQVVEDLHRIDPNAVPVAKLSDPYAIPRVSNQVRNTSPPADRTPSPEHMLVSRVSNMQEAVSKLVAEAKRKGISVGLPTDETGDLGARLQMLNNFHFNLERKLEYFERTTPEQRAIDELRSAVARLQKAFLAQDDLLKVLIAKSGDAK
jgi:hypothetical protein